jgi:hypothetical protein
MRISLIISICLIIFSFESSAQKKDTILVKYSNDNIEQLIFIDTPNSKYHYKTLEILTTIRPQPRLNQQKIDNPFINQEWISVKLYDNKFYGYHPSEPYFNAYFFINKDSITYNDFNEGLVSYKIVNTIKSQRKMSIFYKKDQKKIDKIKFIKINNLIIKLKSSSLNIRNIYLINTNDFFSIPIIVNFCPNNRCPEFIFD